MGPSVICSSAAPQCHTTILQNAPDYQGRPCQALRSTGTVSSRDQVLPILSSSSPQLLPPPSDDENLIRKRNSTSESPSPSCQEAATSLLNLRHPPYSSAEAETSHDPRHPFMKPQCQVTNQIQYAGKHKRSISNVDSVQEMTRYELQKDALGAWSVLRRQVAPGSVNLPFSPVSRATQSPTMLWASSKKPMNVSSTCQSKRRAIGHHPSAADQASEYLKRDLLKKMLR